MNSRQRTCTILLAIALVAIEPAAVRAFADQATDSSASSAKSLAKLLQEHYRQAHTLAAVFLERYSEGQKQERVESGTVYFRRPGQMRWEYDSPEKKLFLVDGKMTWFYVPYDHTVTKAPVKESSDWRTPLALLTGKADLNRLCGKIDVVDQPGTPAGHAILRCLPKGEKGASKQEEYTEVLLEMAASTGELARIEIRQPGAVEIEYRFGKWQTEIPLEDSLFRFQVPVGVAVVDGALLSGSPI